MYRSRPGYRCFKPLSTIFYSSEFYLWRKQKYCKNNTDLSQTTDKLYQINLYRVHITIGVNQVHNFLK